MGRVILFIVLTVVFTVTITMPPGKVLPGMMGVAAVILLSLKFADLMYAHYDEKKEEETRW